MPTRLRALLLGYGSRGRGRHVALNAGALLMTAGLARRPARRHGAARWTHLRRARRGERARRLRRGEPCLIPAASWARSSRASGSTSRRGWRREPRRSARAREPTTRSLARGAGPARRALRHGDEARLAVAGRARATASIRRRWRAPMRGAADAISVLTDAPLFRRLVRRSRRRSARASTGRSWPRISSSIRARSPRRASTAPTRCW